MRNLFCLLLLVSLVAGVLPAQSDVIFYKFDEGTGTTVRNLVPPSTPAPAQGTILSTYPGSTIWTPGCHGPWALQGSHFDANNPGTPNGGYYNHVDTGWQPNFTGSFSVAWFQKQRAPYTSLAYLFSNVGSFRLFHGGVAYKGLYLRAWGGTPADLILYDPNQTTSVPAFDLVGASAERWVHVAIVVDATAMRATWYIDGRPLNPSIPITAPASIAATSNLLLCRHTSTSTSYKHDIDEFRFLTRAAAPGEVYAWSRLRHGEAYVYGRGCGGTLSAQTAPALNQPFMMDLTGPAGSMCLVSIGTSRTRLGAIPLPLDLGVALPYLAGCPWESNLVLTLGAALDPAGKGICVLPIPANPLLIGMTVFNQALIVAPTSQVSTTNGLGVLVF